MSMKDQIAAKLSAEFAPSSLEVIDESHLHKGHMGARPEGETHFRVIMSSPNFAGKSRVEQHRAVNETLSEELASTVHALALKLSAS